MLPSELHDPVARTAAMARIEETRAAQPEGKSSLLPDAPERAAASTGGLSPAQIAITALFGLAVFGGMFLLLINSGK